MAARFFIPPLKSVKQAQLEIRLLRKELGILSNEPKNGDASTRAPQTAKEVRAQLQTETQRRTPTKENAREPGENSGVRRVSE